MESAAGVLRRLSGKRLTPSENPGHVQGMYFKFSLKFGIYSTSMYAWAHLQEEFQEEAINVV